MKWQYPPIIKIYEALGCVADNRIEVSGYSAKVFSSSGNKFYQVSFEPEASAIMSNDNGAYWQGYLGYPAIAFLFKLGILDFKSDIANLLKGIKWKDLNQKFKNDFDQSIALIDSSLSAEDCLRLKVYVQDLDYKIKKLDLAVFGPKVLPPKGY